MRKLLTILTPALALACGLLVAGSGVVRPDGPPPRPQLSPELFSPEAVRPAPPGEIFEEANRSCAEAAEAAGASSTGEPSAAVEEALPEGARLLALLIERAESGEARLPMELLHEIAALIDADPKAASDFLDAMETGNLRLSCCVRTAFHLLKDRELGSSLLAEARRRDPLERNLSEILADRGDVLAVLEDPTLEGLKGHLINRLGPGLSEDAAIRAVLHLIANGTEGTTVRTYAIKALGIRNDPETVDFLLEVFRDTARDSLERRAAATLLSRHKVREAVPDYLDLLDRGAVPALRRAAATGLRVAPESVVATDTLVRVLLTDGEDPQTRRNAASSLAVCLKALPEAARSALRQRVRGAMQDLAGREGTESRRLLVYTMSEITGCGSRDYDDDVRSLYRNGPSILRDEMLSNPVLGSIIRKAEEDK